MKVIINEESYEVINQHRNKYERYFHKGTLVKELPAKAKVVGYVRSSSGEYIGITGSPYNAKILMIPGIVGGVIVTLFVLIFLSMGKPEVEEGFDVTIDTGERDVPLNETKEEVIILRYNRFVSYQNGMIDIRIVNGGNAAKISVSGEGIESEEVELAQEEELYYLPIKIDSKEELINGELNYTINGELKTYQVTIENPVEDQMDFDENVTFEYEEVITE